MWLIGVIKMLSTLGTRVNRAYRDVGSSGTRCGSGEPVTILETPGILLRKSAARPKEPAVRPGEFDTHPSDFTIRDERSSPC